MRKNKIYGYMVGYRERGSRFIRYYTTFTYRCAYFSMHFYQKYPPRERESNRPLIDPVWEIQPITKKSILRGILDEIPFLRPKRFPLFVVASLAQPKPEVNGPAENCSNFSCSH